MSEKEKWKAEARQIVPHVAADVFRAPRGNRFPLRDSEREQAELLDDIAEALYEGNDGELGRLLRSRLLAAIDNELCEAVEGRR